MIALLLAARLLTAHPSLIDSITSQMTGNQISLVLQKHGYKIARQYQDEGVYKILVYKTVASHVTLASVILTDRLDHLIYCKGIDPATIKALNN